MTLTSIGTWGKYEMGLFRWNALLTPLKLIQPIKRCVSSLFQCDFGATIALASDCFVNNCLYLAD